MKNKVLIMLIMIVAVFSFVACGKEEKQNNNDSDNNKAALEFKEEYEKLNGTVNKNGKEHRTITLSENNRFVKTTAEEIVKKIENEDSFYIYFGSNLCPWCRSVIEMADKVSRENDIDKIYYVDIWDEDGNEILRDKYIVNSNNKIELSVEGTDSYKKLLEYLDELLEDYNVTDNNGESISTGEKRIYAPNFFYISKGKATRMTTGTSPLQKDSREELTEEMLKDEEEMFDKFFINACDSSC